MNIRRKLSRNKDEPENHKPKIICEDPEIRNFIEKWTESEGWKIEDLIEFIRLAGEDIPVELKDFSKEEHSFSCVTSNKKVYSVSLKFSNKYDKFPEISITDQKGTRIYETNSNYFTVSKPKLKLVARVVKKGNNVLKSNYYLHSNNRLVQFDETHSLKVVIKHSARKEDMLKLSKEDDEFEEILLNLGKEVSLCEVYKDIIRIFGLNTEEEDESNKITMTYLETNKPDGNTRAKIEFFKGKIQEYIVYEGTEAIHICRNGNWDYTSKNIKASYVSEDGSCMMYIQDQMDNLMEVDIKRLMKYVKERIKKLSEVFE